MTVGRVNTNVTHRNKNYAERKRIRKDLPLWKRAAPHVLLIVSVVGYILLGALIFQHLETNNGVENKTTEPTAEQEKIAEFLKFVRQITSSENQTLQVQIRLEELLECFEFPAKILTVTPTAINDTKPTVAEEENGGHGWENFWSAVLFSFTTVSTIGYGHIYPLTVKGRIFCVFYTLLGIPLFMITVADVGKFLWEGLGLITKLIRKSSRCCFGRSDKEQNEKDALSDAGDLPLWVSVPALTVTFAFYTAMGAALLAKWEGMAFLEAFYFCFISLTTVGFGDVVPENAAYLIPTLIYIFLGLALTTLAIEVLATALRRMHYLGKKIKGAANAKLWLGDKLLSVNDLVRSVGRELGATEEQMVKISSDFDNVMEEAVWQLENNGEISMLPPLMIDDIEEESTEKTLINEDKYSKYSGSYDNIPESWKQWMPFMDDTPRTILRTQSFEGEQQKSYL